ncbi:hypothetical protein M595_0935 [Lyngbya aestuarii BL J]|uniref:Uncharacterized protein n=1 Tax=Lyngbya aestuarii BL J TaxID=1348334 RepID=U7QP78_9CYAN|nr:hypothetical protein M595_0935 [Lyngbya aestuarii BL J]
MNFEVKLATKRDRYFEVISQIITVETLTSPIVYGSIV